MSKLCTLICTHYVISHYRSSLAFFVRFLLFTNMADLLLSELLFACFLYFVSRVVSRVQTSMSVLVILGLKYMPAALRAAPW